MPAAGRSTVVSGTSAPLGSKASVAPPGVLCAIFAPPRDRCSSYILLTVVVSSTYGEPFGCPQTLKAGDCHELNQEGQCANLTDQTILDSSQYTYAGFIACGRPLPAAGFEVHATRRLHWRRLHGYPLNACCCCCCCCHHCCCRGWLLPSYPVGNSYRSAPLDPVAWPGLF